MVYTDPIRNSFAPDQLCKLSNIKANAKPFLRGSLQTIHAQSSVTVTSIFLLIIERRHNDVIYMVVTIFQNIKEFPRNFNLGFPF